MTLRSGVRTELKCAFLPIMISLSWGKYTSGSIRKREMLTSKTKRGVFTLGIFQGCVFYYSVQKLLLAHFLYVLGNLSRCGCVGSSVLNLDVSRRGEKREKNNIASTRNCVSTVPVLFVEKKKVLKS